MKNYPTMRQLQYLSALKKHGSFQNAALACNVSQPTLSTGIQDLENLLGIPVVERSTRKITFTRIGNDLVDRNAVIFKTLDTIMDAVSAHKKPLTGIVRLGVIPTIAPYYLPQLLPTLEQNYPELEIHIEEGLSSTLIQRLEDGEIDIALMAFPYPVKGLEHQIVFEEPFFAAGLAKDLKKFKTIGSKDLERFSLLLLEDGHCIRDHALSVCDLSGSHMSNNSNFRGSSMSTLIQMVKAGYGVTLLPEMVVKNSPLASGLAVRKLKIKQATRQIGLAYRKSQSMKNNVMAFADTMRALL